MDNIYALSNMPKRFKKEIPLIPEEVDRDAFIELRDWRENVEEHIENGEGLFIIGQAKGTGKTTWATKMMNSYFLKVALTNNLRCRGLYINVPKFFQDLKNSFDNPSDEFSELLESIEKADLIIWDDIGTESPTRFVRDILYTYIDYRYSHELSQIFTSNVPIRQLQHEEWLGDRIVSRIQGSSKVIELKAVIDKRVGNQ